MRDSYRERVWLETIAEDEFARVVTAAAGRWMLFTSVSSTDMSATAAQAPSERDCVWPESR